MTDLVVRSSVCHVVRVEMWSYENLRQRHGLKKRKKRQIHEIGM